MGIAGIVGIAGIFIYGNSIVGIAGIVGKAGKAVTWQVTTGTGCHLPSSVAFGVVTTADPNTRPT